MADFAWNGAERSQLPCGPFHSVGTAWNDGQKIGEKINGIKPFHWNDPVERVVVLNHSSTPFRSTVHPRGTEWNGFPCRAAPRSEINENRFSIQNQRPALPRGRHARLLERRWPVLRARGDRSTVRGLRQSVPNRHDEVGRAATSPQPAFARITIGPAWRSLFGPNFSATGRHQNGRIPRAPGSIPELLPRQFAEGSLRGEARGLDAGQQRSRIQSAAAFFEGGRKPGLRSSI
jgi:hypothetical protein